MKEVRALSKEEMERVEKSLMIGISDIRTDKKERLRRRNLILFLMLKETGLRISDVLNLRVDKVLHCGRVMKTIKVKEQKTKKIKNIFISDRVKRELEDYIEDYQLSKYQYIFSSIDNPRKPIGRIQVFKILKLAGEQVDIEVSGHSIRKGFGKQYIKKYGIGNIAELQEIYQHDRPTTTRRYIGLDREEIEHKQRNLWR